MLDERLKTIVNLKADLLSAPGTRSRLEDVRRRIAGVWINGRSVPKGLAAGYSEEDAHASWVNEGGSVYDSTGDQ